MLKRSHTFAIEVYTVTSKSYRTHSIILFLTLLIAYSYFLPRWAEWSQNSRINLTRAIVEQGTLKIDDYYENTGDYALFEGHHYSDKAPGPALLAVPIYAIIRPVLLSDPVQQIMQRAANNEAFSNTLDDQGTGLKTDKIYSAAILYAVTFCISVVPSAVLGVLLFYFLLDLGTSVGWSTTIVLIYGLATNAFTYAGALYSHQFVAFLLFGAFYITFKIKRKQLSPLWALLAGFALGYALISEYPSFLIAAALFIYMLWVLYQRYARDSWRWIGLFIASGIPPGLLLIAYDMAIFGTPLPVGYEYSELYTDIHHTGFLSLTGPRFDALWGITFSSYRGLFFIAPVLLLALVGLWLWWRSGQQRAEWLVCTWATASFLLFNGSSIMWEGGFGVGPRYVVPMLPFLAAGMGSFAIRWGKLRGVRLLTGLLTAWSLFAVWTETLGGQGYPPWDPNPLFDYSLPFILRDDVARNLGMFLGLHGRASIAFLILILVVFVFILRWQMIGHDETHYLVHAQPEESH